MKNITVNNYDELYKAVGVEDQNGLDRAVYKGTNCGASCQKVEHGVMIGSIVEGVDGDGTEYHTLTFPFTMKKFWETLQAVEDEADLIWHQTHGCPQCPEDPESGMHIIDPECPNCHGNGVIL